MSTDTNFISRLLNLNKKIDEYDLENKDEYTDFNRRGLAYAAAPGIPYLLGKKHIKNPLYVSSLIGGVTSGMFLTEAALRRKMIAEKYGIPVNILSLPINE